MSATQTPKEQARFREEGAFRAEMRKADLRDRVWEAMVSTFRERAERDGLTQAQWAAAAEKTAAQVNRMLSKPRNLTLDSIAEYLSAIDAILDVSITDARHPQQTTNVHFEPSEAVPQQSVRVTVTSEGGPMPTATSNPVVVADFANVD